MTFEKYHKIKLIDLVNKFSADATSMQTGIMVMKKSCSIEQSVAIVQKHPNVTG
ncbi:MAG: hypothetical protein JRJ42_03405 [Deltaproteobacteria bacterium]|nr:hypothetical protein [Deltaproteobacteria bacterium]MBW2018484.1 hypothetical protein [Deltaproteobacteria bacterium]MBW2074141.1 hypothetical protein [Deltaproteobacteria bacterium]